MKRHNRASLKLGNDNPRKHINAYSEIAPIKIRPAAKVRGGKSLKAMRTNIKAPPHIIAIKPMRNQLSSPGDVIF
jgi:hypothetical protein